MKVGDLVGSSDPCWSGKGIVVDVQEGRMGNDLNIREINVWWYDTGNTGFGPNRTWAMKNGLKVMSNASR